MVYDFIRLLSGVLNFFFNLLLVLFEALKSDGDITLLLLTQKETGTTGLVQLLLCLFPVWYFLT